MEKETRSYYVGKFDFQDRLILFIARGIIFLAACAVEKGAFWIAERLVGNHCWTEFFLKGGFMLIGVLGMLSAMYILLAKLVECCFAGAILASSNEKDSYRAVKEFLEKSRIFNRTIILLKVDLFVIVGIANAIIFASKGVKRIKKAYKSARC